MPSTTVQTALKRGGRAQRLLVPAKALILLAFTWGVLYPALLWSLRHVV